MTTINLKEQGAAGDGKVLITEILQKSLDLCAEQGGGKVLVEGGVFRTGVIRIPSGVSLYIEHNAVLLASDNLEDYRYEGEITGLIIARDGENIAIEGPGTLDGNGEAFASDKMVDASMFPIPYKSEDGPRIMKPRPGNLVAFSNCKNVRIQGLTVKDSPYWTLHFDGCHTGRIQDVTVRNDVMLPNNDGIHVTCSENVIITGCDIVAGDDAIAITGLDDHQEMVPGFIGYARPTKNVTVSDCLLHSRGCGVRVGYGANDVRHIQLENLTCNTCHRGVGVFVRNPGSVCHVTARNLQIFTRFYDGHWWGMGEPIHVSLLPMFEGVGTGKMEDIYFSDIVAESSAGVLLWADDPGRLSRIQIRNLDLRLKEDPIGDICGGWLDIMPDAIGNRQVIDHVIPGILAHRVSELELDNVRVTFPENHPDYMSEALELEEVDGLRIKDFQG